MPNLTWIGHVIFFAAYFIAWTAKEIPHTTWLNVTAITALVVAIAMVLFNGYVYSQRQHPIA